MDEEANAQRDILALPYSERQFISITSPTPDPLMDSDIARSQPSTGDRGRELMASAKRYAREHKSGAVIADAVGAMRPPTTAVAETFKRGASILRKRSTRQASAQGMRVLAITGLEAGQLNVPHGHPRAGMIYAGHPLLPLARSYFPVADFHQRVFEHKFAELLRILTSLGATRIEVSASEGWSSEVASKLDVALPDVAVGSKRKMQHSREQELLYQADLPNNTSTALPDDIVWYAFEETWKEVARQRLAHGLRNFRLQLTYRDDFGVTKEIAHALTKAGFNLGGGFTQQVNTTWLLSGTFGDPQ
jgi:hypothetical protein